MQVYAVNEAQAQFVELMRRAEEGEQIGIERDGVVFVLTGVRETSDAPESETPRP